MRASRARLVVGSAECADEDAVGVAQKRERKLLLQTRSSINTGLNTTHIRVVAHLELPFCLSIGSVVRDTVDVDIVASEVRVLVAERASLGVATGCGTLNQYPYSTWIRILTRVGLGHSEQDQSLVLSELRNVLRRAASASISTSTSARITYNILAFLILERDAREDVADVDGADRHSGDGGRVQRSIADWLLRNRCAYDCMIMRLAVWV